MTPSRRKRLTSPDLALIDLFERRGCAQIDPPVLQPAGLFLDLSGEDIRRRLFLSQDLEGRELCLRPEYTIPVCVQHIADGGGAAEYCYLGPVFRQRPGESGEFLQAGIESIGRGDFDAADADALALALDGVALYPARRLEVRFGDMGIIEALLDALDVPQAARRRLIRRLSAGHPLDEVLGPENRPVNTEYAGLLAAIGGQDAKAARAFVEDVISIAGIAKVGGRSAGEIAERFLDRAANPTGGLSDRVREVLRGYLGIAGPADRVMDDFARLARGAGLDLGAAFDRYRRRLDQLTMRGIDVAGLHFSAAFARSLDYYTGLIFEIRDPARPDGRFVVAGGRYDRLLQRLGSPGPVPAVGCSFWLDRLGEATT